jgi:HEAT repeat protein
VRDPGNLPDAPSRRREVIVAGHRGDGDAARGALNDPEPEVRAAAVGAAARAGALTADNLVIALEDADARVRRRAVEVAATTGAPAAPAAVVARLADDDPSVAEVAAWALGELSERAELPPGTVDALAELVTGHDDALVREAAVAALGAIGDTGGLPAILAATADRPAVRRRAVLALAPFEGPEVAAALERARHDRDWQVRDAAELLLGDD